MTLHIDLSGDRNDDEKKRKHLEENRSATPEKKVKPATVTVFPKTSETIPSKVKEENDDTKSSMNAREIYTPCKVKEEKDANY